MVFEIFDSLESVLAMYAGLVAGVFLLAYWLIHRVFGKGRGGSSQGDLSYVCIEPSVGKRDLCCCLR